jgi:hypothetical protein
MAIQYVCDGCGRGLGGGTPFKDLGQVIKAQYCATCSPIVEQMITDIDALHNQLARTWQVKREKIRGKARAMLNARSESANARLPDE